MLGSMTVPGTPRGPPNIFEGLQLPWNSMEYHGMPYKSKLPQCPQGSLECLGIAWNIVEYHIKINSLGASKGLWSALE